jgi:hypothetical protein
MKWSEEIYQPVFNTCIKDLTKHQVSDDPKVLSHFLFLSLFLVVSTFRK